MEEENNNMLLFLDVMVEKVPSSFVTSEYQKPTFMRLYISWDSLTPKSKKINFVKCLTYRAQMICSDRWFLSKALKSHWFF